MAPSRDNKSGKPPPRKTGAGSAGRPAKKSTAAAGAAGSASKAPSSKPKPKTHGTKGSHSAVPRGIVSRASRLAFTSFKGSLRLAMYAPRRLLNLSSTQKMLEEMHAATARELVDTLGRLKGAAMKVGQLASFIDAGVLPPGVRDLYQATLGSLRDAAPPMNPRLVNEAFIREFEAEPDELFLTFEMKPFAAASLGQVHRARMSDGREVVVKIQYPGIDAAVKSDLAMTAAVKPLLPLLAPGLEVDEAMKEIRARVLEECDYLYEAKSLDYLAERYAGHPFVWVPRSIPERSSLRILTMEKATGMPFEQMRKLPQAQRDRIGEILFRFYYGSLHRYGFTSADPHPGNYMLMEDGRMAFFDFGLSCHLRDEMKPDMLHGLQALNKGDVKKFFRAGIEMGYVSHEDEIDPERFYEWGCFSLAPIINDEDYTFTREFIAERTSALLDVRNPWWSFIRRLNMPSWAILLYRLELGLFAVLAQLGATGNWHRMTMEFYGKVKPTTELGRMERDWLNGRSG